MVRGCQKPIANGENTMTPAKPVLIDLKNQKISMDVLKLLPLDFIKRHTVLPLEIKQGKLSVVMSDPSDTKQISEVQSITGYELIISEANAESILETLDRHMKTISEAAYCKDLDLRESTEEGRTSQTVDRLFELALGRRASDIHLEPQSGGLFVRLRTDGVLHTMHEFPKAVMPAILSRVKIMASMDIAEKRLPQDGQISAKVRGKDIDMRISTLPGKYGEKVVIRILDKSGTLLSLSHLGMDPKVQSEFEMLVDKPQGILIVTGPTGSGKSTTLYSVLNRLKSPFKNIITLEDPIEYELIARGSHEAGATQVQMHPKIGLTFAAGLRASLRQDPDIIMVGEIRDQETAEVAIKAAMTGHLVLTTLHTNSASETVGRLRDIGIESYLIASTVLSIMAQRLVRVLCVSCKQPYELPERALKTIFPDRTVTSKFMLYRPKGCDACQGSGYWGRRGIYELLVMNEAMRELIHRNVPSAEIKVAAQKLGMKTLRESGLDLVFQGVTTVDEVFRNTVE
jgi:type II secretory ATPase GspE/PulE/Tfp pilus assembly ATPase PilB-like protein